MHTEADIRKLADDFAACQPIFDAVGDANRFHLMLEMMHMGECKGVRVGEITEKTHLSRPAVSHHLQILKNAGILKVRKEGTKNYYFFDPDMEGLTRLISVLQRSAALVSELPNRRGDMR